MKKRNLNHFRLSFVYFTEATTWLGGPYDLKIAVIGSRTFSDYDFLKDTLRCIHITEIVSGGDLGADKLAERYAQEKNIHLSIIPHTEHPETTGASRTYSIISLAQLVIAFWDGKSPGTADLLKYAQQKGKKIVIKYF